MEIIDRLIKETEEQYTSLREQYQHMIEAIEQTKYNLIALDARLVTLRELRDANNDAAE